MADEIPPDSRADELETEYYRPQDPIERFRALFERARGCEATDATAAALATATAAGEPSVRIVLLKGVPAPGERGFVFFTNYESRKAVELRQNPRASLCLHWPTLVAQVRIDGSVQTVSAEESDAYFATRPRQSQIGAWASRQSASLVSRELLLRRYRELEEEHRGRSVPRPPFWGGYRLQAERLEFWQGVAYRLHHRIRYAFDGSGWRSEALYP